MAAKLACSWKNYQQKEKEQELLSDLTRWKDR